MESKKGRLKINADCTAAKIIVQIVQADRKVKSFTLADIDDTEHTLEMAVKGRVVLDITLENARLYSVEVV